MLRQLIFTRGMYSLLTVALENLWAVNKITQYMSKKVVNLKTIGRGGESVVISSIMRLMKLGLGMLTVYGPGDEEEDKKNWEQVMRLFWPMWMQIIIDSYKSRSPLKMFRIMGQWGVDGYQAGAKWINPEDDE